MGWGRTVYRTFLIGSKTYTTYVVHQYVAGTGKDEGQGHPLPRFAEVRCMIILYYIRAI